MKSGAKSINTIPKSRNVSEKPNQSIKKPVIGKMTIINRLKNMAVTLSIVALTSLGIIT